MVLMSHGKLADVVVRMIEDFDQIDDQELGRHMAVKYLEGISADLSDASPAESAAVKAAARARLEWFDRAPGEHEYAPCLSPPHRRCTGGIACGDAWRASGWAT